MDHTRRDLAFFLPLLAAASEAAAEEPVLPSKVYRYEDLPVKASGENRQRQMFSGATHTGYHVDMHETELAPGQMPHAAHHHVHEEMIMIREGQMEVTINGKTFQAGPGSVAYVASNEEHGWKNVGTTRARYFVLALGPKS